MLCYISYCDGKVYCVCVILHVIYKRNRTMCTLFSLTIPIRITS